jgi:hypothetical protein
MLGVVGEIPLKEIDSLFLVAKLGTDKGLVSHQLTAGIDRSVCARANQDSASTVGKTTAPALSGPREDICDHNLSLATVVLALERWGGDREGRGPTPSLVRIRLYTLGRHDPELTPGREEMMWEPQRFLVAPLLGVYKLLEVVRGNVKAPQNCRGGRQIRIGLVSALRQIVRLDGVVFQVLNEAQYAESARLSGVDCNCRSQILFAQGHEVVHFALIFDEPTVDRPNAKRPAELEGIGVTRIQSDGAIGISDPDVNPFG